MKTLLYFGCIRESGHYLWISRHMRCHSLSSVLHYLPHLKGVNERFLQCLDGIYTPAGGPDGRYKVSIVPPFTVVAWIDRSQDTRPGSNSALLGIGMSPEQMLDEALIQFPEVMQRQPRPVPEA